MVAQSSDKGKIKRIDNNPQVELFDPQWVEEEEQKEEAEQEEQAGPQRLPQFLNPDPRGIRIGRKTLKEHLQSCGEEGILQQRDFLQGLDWSSFKSRYGAGGRRPYHPAAMTSLVLFGISQGQCSLRELEKLAQMDARGWWLTGGLRPDHSAIGHFLNLHAKDLTEDFFVQMTRQVLKHTGGKGEQLAGDGTLVQAAASRYRRLKQEAAEQQAEEARQAARQEPENAALQEKARRAQKVAETAQERAEAREKNRAKGVVKVSPTEPEAVIQPLKKGPVVPAYRPSVLANPNRVVVAQKLHGSSENEVFGDLLEQARRVTGGVKRVILDAGYFDSKVLQVALNDPELEDLLCVEAEDEQGNPRRKSRGHALGKEKFEYEEEQDRYRCPAGEYLWPGRKGRDRGKEYRVYRGKACKKCALRQQCTQQSRREIRRWEGEELKEAMREVMSQPGAQRMYRQRKSWVEPVFSEMKGVQRLTRFLRFGLAGVSLEFALHAMAHNLRRLTALSPLFLSILARLLGYQRTFCRFIPHLSSRIP